MESRAAARARLILTIAHQLRPIRPRNLDLAVRECLDGTWQGRVFDRHGFNLKRLVASVQREIGTTEGRN